MPCFNFSDEYDCWAGEHEKNAPQYSVDWTNASNSSRFMPCSTLREPGTMKVLAHASMKTKLLLQGPFFNRDKSTCRGRQWSPQC